MKTLIVLLASVLLITGAWGEDNIGTSSALVWNPGNQHYFSINTETGQLSVDGKDVERFTDPELRAAMKDISESMLLGQKNNEMIKIYDNQTGYLLKELEACHNQLRKFYPDVNIKTK